MFAFFASILSNDSSQGSFSRVSGALIITALIAWATWIVYLTRAIPDVPTYWLYLVLGLYGLNKGFETMRFVAPTFGKGGADAGKSTDN